MLIVVFEYLVALMGFDDALRHLYGFAAPHLYNKELLQSVLQFVRLASIQRDCDNFQVFWAWRITIAEVVSGYGRTAHDSIPNPTMK